MAKLLQIFDPISSGSAQEESGYQICRFCLENSGNYINLLEKCGEEISTFMQTYHNVTIDPCDSWPKNACISCVSRITSFRTLCETIRNSEEALRQIFGDSSNNVCIKKEEDEEEEAYEEVFSESLPESFPETLPESFPKALPESFPESVMETKIKEELPMEKDLVEIEEFFSMTCDLCKKEFIKSSDLRLHFTQEHKKRWYIRCCKSKFKVRKYMIEHIQYHRNPEIFKCPHCLRQFMSEMAKTAHMKNWHMPEKRIFVCDICQNTFACKAIMRMHIEQKHLKIQRKRIISRKVNSHHKPIKDYVCEICGKSFDCRESLNRHSDIHRRAVGPNGESLRAYTCEKCANTYLTQRTLDQHMKKHNPYGTYKCKECGKVSPSPGALIKHIRDAHELPRAYVCHICNKGFKRNIALKEHVATHTGEYLYTCDYCPKQFRASASKSQHIGREHPEKRKKR